MVRARYHSVTLLCDVLSLGSWKVLGAEEPRSCVGGIVSDVHYSHHSAGSWCWSWVGGYYVAEVPSLCIPHGLHGLQQRVRILC